MSFYFKRKGSQAPPFMEHCDGEDMTRRIAGGAMNQLGNTSKMITMKLLCALLAAFIAVPARTATVPPPLPPGVKVTHPDGSPLRAALGPVPESAVFKMEGWYLWDPSVIRVGDTWHLFASRWPAEDKMNGWFRSHVIRATSSSLFGPYQFQEVVLHPSKHPWATQAVHNPKVMKVDNRYLIYHLGIPVWQTGFAWAESIEGPWTPVAKPVPATNNPSIWRKPDGSAYAVGKFKPKPTRDGEWDAYMHAFEASTIDGPYRLLGGPGNRLPGNFELEDPTVWHAGGLYQELCTDWESKATGIRKSVVHYTSANGIDYDLVSQVPVWSQTDPVPLAGGGSLRVAGIERPQVVLGDNGQPLALLVSAYPEIKESEPTYIILRPMDLAAPSRPSP